MSVFPRLKKRDEFGRVFKQGRSYGDRYLVLFVLYSDNTAGRVGFAVQRGPGGAVARNRIRRRIKAAFQSFEGQIEHKGDLVILGKRTVLEVSWDDLLASMNRLLRRAGWIARAGGTSR